MRIALAVVLVLSLAACGKKKAPQAPAADQTETQAAPDGDANEEKELSAPMDSDDAAKSSDPEEGGE